MVHEERDEISLGPSRPGIYPPDKLCGMGTYPRYALSKQIPVTFSTSKRGPPIPKPLAYGVYVSYSHSIRARDSSSSVLMHAVCGLAADPGESLKREANNLLASLIS